VRNVLVGIKNVLLWSYERGSWQYDLLCLLIVAIIFLVPGSYFGDRDREVIRGESSTSRGNGIARNDTGRKGFEKTEMIIGATELQEFAHAGSLQIDLVNHPGDAILAFVENRCKCKATLVLPYEMARDDKGGMVYRVWYRKRERL